MVEAAATTRLKRMTAWSSDPTLDESDIAALLSAYARQDADGFSPGDHEWVPTYNLRAAAAEGWRWKMGKSAHLVSTDLDGDRMSSQQLFEHCETMVRKYAGAASPSIGMTPEDQDVVSQFFNP